MVKSYFRGHEAFYDYQNKQWIYLDTKEPIDDKRPCKKCDKMPTKDGYDACLGYISGAYSACCGHGIADEYVIKYSNL